MNRFLQAILLIASLTFALTGHSLAQTLTPQFEIDQSISATGTPSNLQLYCPYGASSVAVQVSGVTSITASGESSVDGTTYNSGGAGSGTINGNSIFTFPLNSAPYFEVVVSAISGTATVSDICSSAPWAPAGSTASSPNGENGAIQTLTTLAARAAGSIYPYSFLSTGSLNAAQINYSIPANHYNATTCGSTCSTSTCYSIGTNDVPLGVYYSEAAVVSGTLEIWLGTTTCSGTPAYVMASRPITTSTLYVPNLDYLNVGGLTGGGMSMEWLTATPATTNQIYILST